MRKSIVQLKCDICKTLIGLPSHERAKMAQVANSWMWPNSLEQYKPKGFDKWSEEKKYHSPEFTVMRQAIDDFTSEYERSRMHWRLSLLDKSDDDHKRWFCEQRIRFAETGSIR